MKSRLISTHAQGQVSGTKRFPDSPEPAHTIFRQARAPPSRADGQIGQTKGIPAEDIENSFNFQQSRFLQISKPDSDHVPAQDCHLQSVPNNHLLYPGGADNLKTRRDYCAV
jgi:hypothetical protein